MRTLYVQLLCPYCRKVKRALDDLGVGYETERVSFFKFRRDEVREVSGQSQVPVLVDPEHGVDGMNESSDIAGRISASYRTGSENIVEYLYETYGDGTSER
ncbi:glutaredoxin family protein [Halobacterium noricense]|uniref:glutaredoxin family protein n=1 Tax=Halobacterium noricense TaxID=223182 RepID=UPI001E2F3E8C|nr:glutathione S-transferase family protein [Halobacterium noricense]UHH24392.1 glutathione S-transferase N-terminal domain-containing protein [Halobacterium noricense]